MFSTRREKSLNPTLYMNYSDFITNDFESDLSQSSQSKNPKNLKIAY